MQLYTWIKQMKKTKNFTLPNASAHDNSGKPLYSFADLISHWELSDAEVKHLIDKIATTIGESDNNQEYHLI